MIVSSISDRRLRYKFGKRGAEMYLAGTCRHGCMRSTYLKQEWRRVAGLLHEGSSSGISLCQRSGDLIACSESACGSIVVKSERT